MWNRLVNFERVILSFKSTVGKRVFWSLTNSFDFALLLFTTWPSILNTRSLAAVVIIAQNLFPAKSLQAGNSNSLATIGECCYTLSASSLQHWMSCSCHFHMCWVNIQLPAQFLSRSRRAPHQVQVELPPTRPHSCAGSRTHSANTGNRNLRGLTSVSNSGQNFKTRVSGSWGKTPGNPFFSGFEMNVILSDKNSISLWNYYW